MECLKPLYLHKHDIYVPCGKCPQCGVNRRLDWATRLFFESRYHLDSYFVTLTYRDAALHWDKGCPQLCKSDVQLWLKRVRRAGYKCRYYAVGEYGSKTYRPHYHVILFGTIPEDVIRDSWPHGLVHIGTVTPGSVMYTLGYLVNAKAMYLADRVRPFSLMSRRPGLGANYINNAMIEWHRCGRKNYVMCDDEQRHMPRYFKTKIFSKIDQVRIAVAVSKQWLEREIEWSRRPAHMRMTYKQLVAYKREQQAVLAQRIRASSKSTQTL